MVTGDKLWYLARDGSVQGPFAGGPAVVALTLLVHHQQVGGLQFALGAAGRGDQKETAAEANREVTFGGCDQAPVGEASPQRHQTQAQGCFVLPRTDRYHW